MTIAIYAAAFTLWIAIVGLVLAFIAGGAPPCSCPIAFGPWMLGERCLKHGADSVAPAPGRFSGDKPCLKCGRRITWVTLPEHLIPGDFCLYCDRQD